MSSPRAYPALATGILAAASGFAAYGVVALQVPIASSLGLRSDDVARLAVAHWLAVGLAVLLLALAVHRRPRRALVAVTAGVAGAVSAGAIAVADGPWALVGLLTVNALAIAAVLVLHPPLLADAYAPAQRVRAFALHRGLQALGVTFAATLVAALGSGSDLTWRGILLVLGAIALAAVSAAFLLRDPGIGRFEPAPAPDAELALSFGEVARGTMRPSSVRRLVAAHGALGIVVVALPLYVPFFLEDRWSLGAGSRGVVYAASAMVLALGLLLFAREGDRQLARGPAALVRAGAALLASAAAALVAAVAIPSFGPSVALLAAALAAIGLGQTALVAALMSVVAPATRIHAAALAALALAGIGGLIGLLVAADAAQEIGTAPALALLAAAAAGAALAAHAAAGTADADAAMTATALREETEVRRALAAGATSPLLECRGLVVNYGHRRAVDGVDLAIARGELVVLIGTNGAGKSTLLRVLSGLQPPNAGSVRMEGREISLLDPERRRRLGIGHVAAGAAVFGSLRVHESLRLAAHAAGLDRRRADEAIARALERFARLGERRDSRVAALSGGERQMLALAQMLLLPPRILLVDELSLGLAPAVVEDLLALVREIHARGTTVVVVEQSADRALALGTRALFLERGRVRFDGAPADLRERDDLLRPVFLSAAGSESMSAAGGHP